MLWEAGWWARTREASSLRVNGLAADLSSRQGQECSPWMDLKSHERSWRVSKLHEGKRRRDGSGAYEERTGLNRQRCSCSSTTGANETVRPGA